MKKRMAITRMATQIAIFRSEPTRATRQLRENFLGPGKLALQYRQVCA
jgi:hypothetical protein